MPSFCTISTTSHLFKAYALAKSLDKYNGKLYILLVDDINNSNQSTPSNVELISIANIQNEKVKQITKKYGRNKDKLRWALKSVLLLHLLNKYDKVVYVDNDIYFFNDFGFLFNELEAYQLLLTPHLYPSSPLKDQTWFEANYRVGLYNAGFVGANKQAKEALNWWTDCCLYEIKKSYYRGLFDDQKYLDLMPVLFDGVKVIKNRGCNIAGWNDYLKVKKEEVTFIHFSPFTMNKFKFESNYYHTFFLHYLNQLKSENKYYKPTTIKISLLSIQNGLYYLRWKLDRIFK